MNKEKKITKKNIFFSFENVLLPDKDGYPPKKTIEAMDFLLEFSNKNKIKMYLISGLSKEKAKERIDLLGLKKYFDNDSIFYANDDYINSKSEEDKIRHEQNLEKNPEFVDHYLKQHILLLLIKKGEIKKEDSILIGNDILFDGFYTTRFSGIDFVLVKDLLTNRGEPTNIKPNGINYISISPQDFEKIIYGELPKQNIQELEKMVFDDLSKQLVGTQLKNTIKKNFLERQKNKK
jgi:hypothetical protein